MGRQGAARPKQHIPWENGARGRDGFNPAPNTARFPPIVLSMLSRTLASQSLRRSLFASSSTLHSARLSPKYVRLNSSTAGQPPSESDGKLPSGPRRRLPLKGPELDPWVPPIFSYEQVKLMTEQPSPVRPHLLSNRTLDSRMTRQDSYLIDVREPDEVVQGSIPSSVNIPLSILPGSLYMEASKFKRKFGFTKPMRDQEIVFYCRSGVRAATAGDIAKKNGFEKSVCLTSMSQRSPNAQTCQVAQLQRILAGMGRKRRSQSWEFVEYSSQSRLFSLKFDRRGNVVLTRDSSSTADIQPSGDRL